MISTDVFSITNPALGSLVIWSFLQGYEENEKSGCSFPLLFLPLPLILSKSIRDEFKGTNAETGLYTWITRKQNVLINLDLRINKCSDLTRNAIIFGCTNEILVIRENGKLHSNNKGVYKGRINNSSDEVKEMINVSKKLGIWLSQINSTSSILNSLGLTL
ncbi:three component ABC system middle component [Brevibacillus fluminis]|uniref:three component ABC system middle component n=1 Tax=Brevibacillus TaxID=55080 RepID=UPI0030F861A9